MQKKLNSLHDFVANNYDFEKLEAILNEFNPFKVLNVDHFEIRHSNVVAWLLDPNENHNLNDKFIKKFIAEVIINNDNVDIELQAFEVQEISYHDFEIRREWNNIDIFVISECNKLAFIIENKIHAKESKGQLDKYFNSVYSEYSKNYNIIPIFLSLNGTVPSDDRYISLSYTQIIKNLKFIIELQKQNLSTKVYDFIFYYLKTLEILTMEDKEIKELCKKIYKKHKKAIDLISEHAKETEFAESAKKFITDLESKEILINGRSAWFIPNSIESNLEKVGEDGWCEDYPIAFWYRVQEEKLGLILEVGPFKDGSLRRDFLTHLKNNGFDKISDRSFKPDAKYTRIFSKYLKFSDWDNSESIMEKMDELYKKSNQAIEDLDAACSSFKWAGLDDKNE